VADKYGNIATLLGRDCTLQRRHQKLVEEGPITIADYEILSKLEYSSMKLMKFINYYGVGTVEFLYLPKINEFFFLEINPRLQVEHPVTEVITKTNLPSIQLLLGAKISIEE
jgi:acetyl/propionyl-CoA carboxylase alpha subunit